MRSFASPAIGAAKSPVLCVATHLWLEGTVHPTLQATYAGATPIGKMRSCRNATDNSAAKRNAELDIIKVTIHDTYLSTNISFRGDARRLPANLTSHHTCRCQCKRDESRQSC